MKLPAIEALGKAAYSVPLRPGEVRPLGKHTEVWAVSVYGTHERKTHKYLTLHAVTLTNGERTVTLDGAAFPKPGRRGVSVQGFADVIWTAVDGHSKTRLILPVWDSAANYGPLDVHDLDARVSYMPSGGDAFTLRYHGSESGPNLEFIDLSVFYPGQEFGDVCREYGVQEPAAEPTEPRRNPAGVRTFTESRAAACWHVLSRLRAVMGDAWGIDPCVYRTPAACAARVYVSNYLQAAPAPAGMLKAVRFQAMRSAWGGRMEAFARGHFDGDISVYDAESLYPHAVMNLGVMPTANSWVQLTYGMLGLPRVLGGICSVRFDFRKFDGHGEMLDASQQEAYPCLPVTGPHGMVYPLHGVSHCTVAEVRYALELGAHVEILSGFGYLRGDDSLAAFSRDMLTRKRTAQNAGDTVQRGVYKLLMNSLYGKFAQARTGYSLDTMRAAARALGLPDLATLQKIPNWPQMYGDILAGGQGDAVLPEVTIGGQWMPEWAALIQGYARMAVSRAMRDYVAMAGTVDSVTVFGDAGDVLYVDGVPGVAWKREARGTHAVIVRARLYALETAEKDVVKVALHGAPQIANMPRALLDWAGGTELQVQAQRVRKLRDGLMSGNPVGQGSTVELRVSLEWDGKRSLAGEGWSEPWEYYGEVSTEPAAD